MLRTCDIPNKKTPSGQILMGGIGQKSSCNDTTWVNIKSYFQYQSWLNTECKILSLQTIFENAGKPFYEQVCVLTWRNDFPKVCWENDVISFVFVFFTLSSIFVVLFKFRISEKPKLKAWIFKCTLHVKQSFCK